MTFEEFVKADITLTYNGESRVMERKTYPALTDYLAEADLTEFNYYVGSMFGSTLNLIPTGEMMNLDFLNYEILAVDKDGWDVYVIIGNDDYRDLLRRLNHGITERM